MIDLRYERLARIAGLALLILAVSAPARAIIIQSDRPTYATPAEAMHADSLGELGLDPAYYPPRAGAVAGIFRIVSISAYPRPQAPASCDNDLFKFDPFWRGASAIELALFRAVHGQPLPAPIVLYLGPTELIAVHWSEGANVKLSTGNLIIAELNDWIVCEGMVLPTLHRARVYDFGPATLATDSTGIRAVEELYQEFYRDAEQAR